MTDKKMTKKEIKALEVQIKRDQEKPVREHERRVRVNADFNSAVNSMANTPPIQNKDLVKWSKKRREDSN